MRAGYWAAWFVAAAFFVGGTVYVLNGRADANQGCRQVAIVGDSLTSEGDAQLHDALPGAIINGRSGRTIGQAVEATQGIAQSNDVDCWVFALGTNDIGRGIDYRTDSRRLLRLTDPADRVWWVVPTFAWWASNTADGFVVPNLAEPIHLVLRDGEYADGVHLTPAGYVERAEQIARGLRP